MAISSKWRSGYGISMTALYTVTSSPTVDPAVRAASADTVPDDRDQQHPGSSTWTAEISAHIRALRTAAWRTSWEARR